ncbi:hypothetical protein SELMODRAFT_416317 [Selaginella moellendorffii]|uniref:Uncharacterized protein n=1 Tax=Selaginella moellendorffii TaxID=88036 RepID=D8RYW8_SELML|nr:hypothetical protein SELMODRAFT_416317 [Selaginella moellendorffii]
MKICGTVWFLLSSFLMPWAHLRVIYTVYEFDTNNNEWSLMERGGSIPGATRGHSATLIRSKIWVYGRVDFEGQLHPRVHALDLKSKQWELVNVSGSIPPPLAFHAAVHKDDHLYLFGAGSSGFCKNLYALNLVNRQWSWYPDQGPTLVPAARFATAVTGDDVGGATEETMLLNMESFKWTVVCAEPRLATEFSVFLLKTMKSYPVLPHPMGKCQVRGVDGSLLALFDIPDAGALEIIDRAWRKVGDRGFLARDGRPLERNAAIFPGDELTFHRSDSVGVDSIQRNRTCEVHLMTLEDCKLVLARLKIEVMRGEGWLNPREEIECEAFAGWNSRRPRDTVTYLEERAKVGDLFRLPHIWSSTAGEEFPYTLRFALDMMLVYMCVAEDIIIGYYIKEEINELHIWRALVMLLGVNIKCRTLKPWVVITDLKDEWHFAWMHWPRMYVCKARSRSQGLGIVQDLCNDYNLVTSPETAGVLSNLPSVYTRTCSGFKCDFDEETRLMFSPHPVAVWRNSTLENSCS